MQYVCPVFLWVCVEEASRRRTSVGGIKYLASSHTSHCTPSLWRWNWYRVPKRQPTTIWCRGNTQKKIYNIQITAKVWNLDDAICWHTRTAWEIWCGEELLWWQWWILKFCNTQEFSEEVSTVTAELICHQQLWGIETHHIHSPTIIYWDWGYRIKLEEKT